MFLYSAIAFQNCKLRLLASFYCSEQIVTVSALRIEV